MTDYITFVERNWQFKQHHLSSLLSPSCHLHYRPQSHVGCCYLLLIHSLALVAGFARYQQHILLSTQGNLFSGCLRNYSSELNMFIWYAAMSMLMLPVPSRLVLLYCFWHCCCLQLAVQSLLPSYGMGLKMYRFILKLQAAGTNRYLSTDRFHRLEENIVAFKDNKVMCLLSEVVVKQQLSWQKMSDQELAKLCAS